MFFLPTFLSFHTLLHIFLSSFLFLFLPLFFHSFASFHQKGVFFFQAFGVGDTVVAEEAVAAIEEGGAPFLESLRPGLRACCQGLMSCFSPPALILRIVVAVGAGRREGERRLFESGGGGAKEVEEVMGVEEEEVEEEEEEVAVVEPFRGPDKDPESEGSLPPNTARVFDVAECAE